MSVSLVSPRLGRYTEQQSRTHSWPGPTSKHTRLLTRTFKHPFCFLSLSLADALRLFPPSIRLRHQTRGSSPLFPSRSEEREMIDRRTSGCSTNTQERLFSGTTGGCFPSRKSSKRYRIITLRQIALGGFALFIPFCRHLLCVQPEKAQNPLSGVQARKIQMKTTSTPF